MGVGLDDEWTFESHPHTPHTNKHSDFLYVFVCVCVFLCVFLQAYDDLITEFMEAAKSLYGEGVLLQVRRYGRLRSLVLCTHACMCVDGIERLTGWLAD